MTRARTLMLQGTASDVGKSVLTAALCRILCRRGFKVAPFKAQNMALNSYVTVDGREIGRAQGVQAEACGIPATTDMNPILLKPSSHMTSQVIVHGRPFRNMPALEYRSDFLPQAESIVKEALARLRESYDIVVLEGAGSPAEVNLKDRDIVNMRLAAWADAPVILVADIDRGGVFASIVGTLEILSPPERERVKGLIINKFRGDRAILAPGIDWLEQRTNKPVLGVIPYMEELGIEDEDSASLEAKMAKNRFTPDPDPEKLDIAAIRFPRMANFTDLDPLFREEDVRLRFVSGAKEWGDPDAVILPGSKNTAEDFMFMRERGLDIKIIEHARKGKAVVGICGGYQMLGMKVSDPRRLESDYAEIATLALLPVETVFVEEKKTGRVHGFTDLYVQQIPVEGYEIHMGRTRFLKPVRHLFTLDGHGEGAVSEQGNIWGTYLHGLFHNDILRTEWLNSLRRQKGWKERKTVTRYQHFREAAFDRLADTVERHLDVDRILQWLKGDGL
jgi:adenosylcobyric acid synthase